MLTSPLWKFWLVFSCFPLKKLCHHKILLSTGISNKPLCDGCRLFFFFYIQQPTQSKRLTNLINCWLLYLTGMASNQTYLTEKPTSKLSPGNNISCFNPPFFLCLFFSVSIDCMLMKHYLMF